MDSLKYKVRLTIRKNDINIFGPGVEELLEGVKKFGSLLKASEKMRMAYSKAWRIIKVLEGNLNVELINRSRGRNSDATLTKEGENILKKYIKFRKEVELEAEKSFKRNFVKSN